MTTEATLVDVLLVEDNPYDAELTIEAFRETKIANHIVVVRSGEDALEYLHNRGKYSDVKKPLIILLDLNLPGMSGLEALEEIKKDETLRKIPVAILTTSTEKNDVTTAYLRHANCYIVKPVTADQMIKAAQMIEGFWFGLVTLPSEPSNLRV
jgi:two-component system, chemotaxis family, response regulator Rcp1